MNKLGNKVGGLMIAFSAMSFQAFADVEEVKEQSFSVSDGSRFSINNVNGSVKIAQWPNSEIRVIATKKGEEQAYIDRITISMEKKGNSVSVDTKYDKKRDYRRSGSVGYQIMLPENMDTTAVELVNGSLVVKEVDGQINANVVNGSIKVIDAQGDSKLKSVNGSVKASYQQVADSVKNIDLQTVNGSIKLYLPSDISAEIDAETMHGSLKSDFALSVDKNLFTGKSMKGVVGAGDINIELESVNGSIKVMEN